MLNILFYTPFNSRSRDTESLMQAFRLDGHQVYLLTQAAEGDYHRICTEFGVKTFSYSIPKKNTVLYFLKHTFFLQRFCRQQKIDLLYAHLENAGLPAVLAQYFIKTKVFTCRHIVDEALLMGSRKFELLNKLVYTLSKRVIVVSKRSKEWMKDREGISAKKIQVIPLAYNFDLYAKPDQNLVKRLREQYPCKLLLITACRMMTGKRPDLSIELCKQLLREGLDVKLILLGSGPLLRELQEKVQRDQLENQIFLLGFQSKVLDFLSAADLLIHPSLQDSSSVILKEAGLCSKPVLCCQNIGDVDEYLIDKENALLVSKENTLEEMLNTVRSFYFSPESYVDLGTQLNKTILKRFNIQTILPEYRRLHAEFVHHEKN